MNTEGLEVRGLCAGYGTMQVVADVDLEVRTSEVVALIGRNGAGKTTLLRAIAGLRHGRFAGELNFAGQSLNKVDPVHALRKGVAFVPEGHRLFRSLTVTENLRMGAFRRRGAGADAVRSSMDRIFELFPVLRDFAGKTAGQMSGGEQQMVSIGQALMSEPRLLLLDEPTSALAPKIGDAIYEAVARLRSEGIAVLVVEQDIDRALNGCDRCYVMDNGRIRLSGTTSELRGNDQVQRIVLGLVDAHD